MSTEKRLDHQRIIDVRRQTGAVTLLAVLILFIGGTLITLISARTAVNEQRLSANEVRARQALISANAGVERALVDRAGVQGGFDPAGYQEICFLDDDGTCGTSNTATKGAYSVRFCNVDASPASCPSTPEPLSCAENEMSSVQPLLVYACGWSDDGSARRPVTTVSTRLESYGTGISIPFVSRGALNIAQGNAKIFNYYNDLTVWTGSSASGQSATGDTYIRDKNHHESNFDPGKISPGQASCQGQKPNPPEGYICSSTQDRFGHDVIMDDISLSRMSDDEFFKSFMGYESEEFKYSVASVSVNTDREDSLDNIPEGISGESIWIESQGGDVTLNGKYGTREEPVLIVVDGDLNLGSNAIINGVVYVSGNIDGSGTSEVHGALIVAGEASTSGNFNVIYDPDAVQNTNRLGRVTVEPGGWRDWVTP